MCYAQELCERRGGRPELPVSNSPYGLCGRQATLNWNSNWHSSELTSCVKIETDVLGSPSLIADNFHLDVHYVHDIMFVQRFETRGRRFTVYSYH